MEQVQIVTLNDSIKTVADLKGKVVSVGAAGSGVYFNAVDVLEAYGLDRTEAGTWTSIILVGISAVCTGFGWYQRLAKHAGAGTLVPITGFSNAISSCAIEARSEGPILGVGAKIFTIAGPVLLYGCTSATLYGLVYYFFRC